MRKLVTAFKVSLDGKIEGAQEMADWAESWSEDYGLTDEIDACVLGGAMYPGYERYWTGVQNEPHKPAWITGAAPTAAEVAWARFAARTPHFVLSKSLKSAAWPNTRIVRARDDIAALKQQSGKTIYLMGGAHTAAEFIDAGLVDEIRLIVYPLIAGPGKALFATTTGRHKLALTNMQQLPGGKLGLTYAIG